MDSIEKLLRPLIAKVLTRGLLWILITLLGVQTCVAKEVATKSAAGIAVGVTLLIAYLIDRWHHRKDLAEQPPRG